MTNVKKILIRSVFLAALPISLYFFSDVYLCVLSSIFLSYCLYWMSSIVMYVLSKIVPIDSLEGAKWELSILISICIYLLMLGMIIWIIFPALFIQYKNFMTILTNESMYSGIIDYMQNFINHPYITEIRNFIEPNLGSFNQDLLTRVVGLAKHFINKLLMLGSSVIYSTQNFVNVSLVFVGAFHIVREWDKWPERIKKLSKVKLISPYYKMINAFLDFCSYKIQHWIQAQIILTFLMWIYYAIAFSILNLSSPILLGFLFGYSGLIPYIGDIFSFANLVIVLVISKASLEIIVATFVIIWVGGLVYGYFLAPIIIGQKTKVNVLQSLFGFLINSKLFGVVGVFLNIPFCIIANGFVHAFLLRSRSEIDEA